jgi:uncharacterized Zn-binding protein involved in type VI secretion
VPTPLPNIAKSGSSPKGYSTTVKIDGNTVAIRGATFESIGDMASKATGGGLISANTHGPAKFITPGSMTVKIEGKSVHLLGEPMLNNCGPTGSPPNTGATMMGVGQYTLRYDPHASPEERLLQDIMCRCNRETPKPPGGCREHGVAKHACCDQAIQDHNPPPEIGGESGYRPDGSGPFPDRATMEATGQDFTGILFPDCCAMSGGQPTQFFDFKFPCGGESDKDFYLKVDRRTGMTQYEKYLEVSNNRGMSNPPKAISNRNCR